MRQVNPLVSTIFHPLYTSLYTGPHYIHTLNRHPICAKILTKYLELLEAVRNSLRAKTAALSDDNWMFEAENEGIVR